VRADELWRHLDEMGVQPEVEHPRLGKPSALLDELIKKRWGCAAGSRARAEPPSRWPCTPTPLPHVPDLLCSCCRRYIHRERTAGPDGEEISFTAAENARDEIGEGMVKAWYEEEFAAAGVGGGGSDGEDGGEQG
jgi:hypothetical protein